VQGPEEVHVLGSLTQLIAAASSGGTNSSYGLLLTLALMGGVFYFLLIRPQQRRMRAQRELMGSLSVGDEVVTIGGMYGSIRELDDEEVVLEVADGIEIRFLRSAIARKVSFDEQEPYEDEDGDEGEHELAEGEKEAGEQS
jgi:preprotein translocase subunit YajC